MIWPTCLPHAAAMEHTCGTVVHYVLRTVVGLTALVVLVLNVVVLVEGTYLESLADWLDKVGFVFIRLDCILMALTVAVAELQWMRLLKYALVLKYWAARGCVCAFVTLHVRTVPTVAGHHAASF